MHGSVDECTENYATVYRIFYNYATVHLLQEHMTNKPKTKGLKERRKNEKKIKG